jgi:ADP-ribose pyrophosphatase
MALARWRKLSESVVFRNPWWTYKLDRFLLPTGREGEYHYVQTPGSSMIIPVENDGTLLLVNQYRYLLGRESLEFPCGGVKTGATHEHTARDELAEEVGRAATELTLAGRFVPMNGVTDEVCHVYIARGLTPSVEGERDDTEEFEILRLRPDEVEARIASGEIWDGMTIAGWCIGRARLDGTAVIPY